MGNEEYHGLKEMLIAQSEQLKALCEKVDGIKESNDKQWAEINKIGSISTQLKGLWTLVSIALGAIIGDFCMRR